jgi:hypothetical protein
MPGLLKRPLAAFLAIWFLLVMIEPESVHSCPVHSAAASSHSGHAGHHGIATGHHSSKDKSSAICSCPGDCTATGFSALPSDAHRLAQVVTERAPSRVHPGVSAELEQPDFLLPFAIGPPAILIA